MSGDHNTPPQSRKQAGVVTNICITNVSDPDNERALTCSGHICTDLNIWAQKGLLWLLNHGQLPPRGAARSSGGKSVALKHTAPASAAAAAIGASPGAAAAAGPALPRSPPASPGAASAGAARSPPGARHGPARGRREQALRRGAMAARSPGSREALPLRGPQAKVLQYRARCQELEQQLEAGGGSLASRWEATEDHSLEKALLQLEEEQQRCENLAEVNTLLREHLDEAKEVNSALREDVGKLTADWMRAREELDLKESEWHSERELYDSHLRAEGNRLLGLWRQVLALRCRFLELRSATERDLAELKAEQMRLSGSILVSCSSLSSGVQLWECVALGSAALRDGARQEAQQEESQKPWEGKHSQVEEDLEKKELQDRVMELSALLVQSQKQNEEKEKTMKTLNDTVEILEASCLEKEHEASLTKSAKEENLFLQKLIKDITEVVLDDSENAVSILCTDPSQCAESGNIFSLSSLAAEQAFVWVQEAVARRRGATQALKEELSAQQGSINGLLQQHRQQEEKSRKLQQKLEQLEEECKMSSNHCQHLQSLVETLKSDCATLEETREELKQQLEVTEQEASRLRHRNVELQHRNMELQHRNMELQLKEESAQGEKVEQQERMERASRDRELLLKDLAALEGKHSLLQSEWVVVRETLEASCLERDLLRQEKQELTVGLEKAEQSVAELTGAQNKLAAEIADLRLAAAKMSSINEALAGDKAQLNKLVLQLEQENEVLSGKVNEMERAKICDQEKLNLCERTTEELRAEKAHLEQLLKKAEEQQEGLQAELTMLGKEKEETQDKLNQVCRQREAGSSELQQLRLEAWSQGQALARAAQERELLVRDKAALEVRLAATQRDRTGLAQQLAHARSAKETLESSLFEAQQNLSQLEITRSQLEMQLHTVTQAKEVIQGEVKCLQRELEAERSLLKQEQADMVQQLLQTEQQYNNTLRLQESGHEVEINKLLQDLASEREGHQSELQDVLEQWEKEKAETAGEHEKKLCDMKQKVAAMQAQQEEERTRVENDKQEVLLEKERERKALLDTLLQTQGELTEACQQLEQLRKEVKEQQESGQNLTEKLQAELQETQSKMKAVENRHKEELKAAKEEMNILLQQRDALQKQVEELTSRLAASEESWQVIGCKAQRDLSEAQELSRQKGLEVVHLQKILEEKKSQWEEVELRNQELQVCLQSLEEQRSRWEAVEHHNTELQALLKVLESEKARLTQSVEEKELSLRTLEESNRAQHSKIEWLQDVVLEQEAALAAREKQLLQELEQSRAGEQSLRESLGMAEAEMSELRSRLCSTESRAEALATECQLASSALCEAQSQLDKLHLVLHPVVCASRALGPWPSEQDDARGPTVSEARDLPTELTADRVAAALQDLCQHLKQTQQELSDVRTKTQDLELELSKRQVEKDHLSAHNQELQKQLAQSQEEMQMAECKKNSLQAALQEEATALKEKAVTLQQEVASLERKLESTEKQRKDALNERDRLQALKEELVWEIKLLQESVTGSESRANTATDRNHCLEQELQAALSDLKVKSEEVEMQWEKIQMLQKEAAEVKALQENLSHMTGVLTEREGEVNFYQEQVTMLEKQKEMHKTALDQVIKDITEKTQKIESQQEYIEELEKKQEQQRVAVSKMNKELEEREQEIRSQQEQIQQLEKQQEMQRAAVSEMSKELEERDQEIKCQEGKITILEQHSAAQVRNLLMDLDHVKGSVKEKNTELTSLTQRIQELEQEREQERSLHESLEQLKAVLKDRESECGSLRDQLRLLQQSREQQEGHLRELRSEVEKMTLCLSQKDQELESQQKQIQEAEEVMEMQLKTVSDQLEQTLETLKEKDILMTIQKQQTQSYEEKTEEQLNVLHRDLEHTKAVLKEKEVMIESQKELLESFQKQEQGSEEQKEILQQLQASLKEQEQEIFSLRKQCEAYKEKEKRQEAEQTDLQATKLTLKERAKQMEVLEEILYKPQQQKEEAAVQTEAMLQLLEHAQASLEAKDQEIVSLQEHIQDLQEQELAGKQSKSPQQDLDKRSQIVKNNHCEPLGQMEQTDVFQPQQDGVTAALTCQEEVNPLEEVVRKRDEDSETLVQKLHHQELKTLQNLQLSEENGELGQQEHEKVLEEASPEREREAEARGEQKGSEEETRDLQEDAQHVQQSVTKKDKEIKCQRDRVRYLEKTLTEREQELRRQSELLRQLTSALQWKGKGQTLSKQIQKLQKWEEEEAEKRKVLQERDHLLQKQKELSQQLEDERKAKGEELERVIAIWKQTESGEIEWKEKAQALALALTRSEMASGTLREEVAILQNMVSERDTDRCQHQALAEGEHLSWLSEKRLLSQQLKHLQQVVARLEHEKTELKQLNAELRRTLEQVERERRRLKRRCGAGLVPDACGFSPSEQHRLPASRQEESHVHHSQLADLQNQVSLLQMQLAQERKDKQDYIKRCAKTSQELSDLHQELSYSLAAVVREPKAAVLEQETQRLDWSLHLSLSGMSPERQPLRSTARPASSDDLR
ncbi:centrosome-associated protein CEP250 [Colius striatus]|uniref:centrosome-associated protein CEP250 n=1 Tax=Colius striatus TaxID=57412 RepID=UPI002B1D14A6|nr:centrosome-associated protein CEP250 [Colius striatus]